MNTKIPFENLEKIKEFLVLNKKTISLAESCTGGLLSYWFSFNAGTSKYFKGSVIAYSEETKQNILKVKKNLIFQKTVVSPEVAESMAIGVRNLLKSDYSLATNGICGPDGGSIEKPVGTINFGFASKIASKSATIQIDKKNRNEIQDYAALCALDFLLSELK